MCDGMRSLAMASFLRYQQSFNSKPISENITDNMAFNLQGYIWMYKLRQDHYDKKFILGIVFW